MASTRRSEDGQGPTPVGNNATGRTAGTTMHRRPVRFVAALLVASSSVGMVVPAFAHSAWARGSHDAGSCFCGPSRRMTSSTAGSHSVRSTSRCRLSAREKLPHWSERKDSSEMARGWSRLRIKGDPRFPKQPSFSQYSPSTGKNVGHQGEGALSGPKKVNEQQRKRSPTISKNVGHQGEGALSGPKKVNEQQRKRSPTISARRSKLPSVYPYSGAIETDHRLQAAQPASGAHVPTEPQQDKQVLWSQLLVMSDMEFKQCDMRAVKISGRVRPKAPDFQVRSEPLWLGDAPDGILEKMVARIEALDADNGSSWHAWMLDNEPVLAGELTLMNFLAKQVRSSIVDEALKRNDTYKLMWEIADRHAACAWAQYDKRPSEARKLCDRLMRCQPYTSEFAAKVGVPRPEATGVSDGDFVLLPVVYHKTVVGVGRWYGTLGAQRVSKEMRARVFSASMVTLDAKSCYPQLVLNSLEGLHDGDIPAKVFREYIDNRTVILGEVQKASNCTTAAAKQLFLRVMYGGKVGAWVHDHGLKVNVKAFQQRAPFVKAFFGAVASAKKLLLNSEDGEDIKRRLEEVSGHRREDPPSDERVFSYLLQTRESEVMQGLQECLSHMGFVTASIIHDALGIFKRVGSQLEEAETLLRDISNCILKEHKQHMRFHVEDLVVSR